MVLVERSSSNLPHTFLEAVFFLSQLLDYLVCSEGFRLASFWHLSCLLLPFCSLLKAAVPNSPLLRCGLLPATKLSDLFQKKMALEYSNCILPTVFYLLADLANSVEPTPRWVFLEILLLIDSPATFSSAG
jgi:hypothetical protein